MVTIGNIYSHVELRNGWRWFTFGKFLNQTRHDNRDMRISLADFLSFDLTKMTRLLRVGGCCTHLAPGCGQVTGCFLRILGTLPESQLIAFGSVATSAFWNHYCAERDPRRSPALALWVDASDGLGWERVMLLAKVAQKIWGLRFDPPSGIVSFFVRRIDGRAGLWCLPVGLSCSFKGF